MQLAQRLASEPGARLGGIALQQVYLRGTEQRRIDPYVIFVIKPYIGEGLFHKLAHRMRFAGGHQIVIRLGLL